MSARPWTILSLAAILCVGCPPEGDPIKDDTGVEYTDADGDGYNSDEDCDDSDPSVYPGAEESCDEIDNDCDGEVDEGAGNTYYADSDGDGYGDGDRTIEACELPDGYVENTDDCDDQDAMQHPGADEYCNDEDDDCDGEIDEGEAVDAPTWYVDADNDGYGADDDTAIACDEPTGYAATNDDCDDSNANQHPGADEYCNGEDDDCDGEIDEDTVDASTTWYIDRDGDGYGNIDESVIQCTQPTGYVLDYTDCDDREPTTYPGATEYCDGADNDCDGLIDEDDAVDGSTWYADADSDGFGDALRSTYACYQPTGYVADNTDCDDTDAAQYPGADEWCNGEDDDCDGIVDEDEAVDVATWYADADGDTYGDATVTDIDCDQPFGYVADNTDCDDADAAQYPGADEYCNGEDDDCDGDIDEDDAVDVATWYADADGDTYGDAATSDIDCDQPTGYVADNTDCDDTDAAQYPGADEYCNGEDDDCDGDIDEDDALDVATWYQDSDGDTYGNALRTDIDCDQPTGYVADNTDCDDRDAAQYPGADEYCNGEDDDCDGIVDEDDALDVSTWYADTDGDTYGDAAVSDIDCNQPTGYVADNTDCDDADPAQHPGADEYCNGEDDDCDGMVDEDDALDVATWYADADGDTYGDAGRSDIDCDQPTGYVADDTDCDDTDPAQYPGATEYCNGEDDDCDGTVDEDDAFDVSTWYADVDGDTYGDAGNTDIDCTQPSGYVADSSDCDDSDPAQYPGADEYCNGEDDDCDGDIDEDGEVLDGDVFYADSDGDGTGDEGSTIVACSQPSGYVDNTWDCNDSDATEPIVVDQSTGSTSGPGTLASPYDMVQDGIDAADECVIVFPGNYTEAVHMNGTDLEITGVEGSELTMIDAVGTGEPAFTVEMGESSATVITGFTLTGDGHLEVDSNSWGCTSIITCTDWYYTWCGGGFYANGSDPTVVDVQAIGSDLPPASTSTSYPDTYYTASYGGGMCFIGSLSAVMDSVVADNYADQGGGVYADEFSAVTFDTTELAANLATDGGGMEVEGMVGLTNVSSRYNDASSDGGGLYLIGAIADLVNTAFVGDDAGTGGGLYAYASSTLDLLNSIVYGSPDVGVLIDGSSSLSASYNNVYGNATNYSGVTDPTGANGNISADPMFIAATDDGVLGNDDLHILPSSPSVNAGDPAAAYNDTDGTRNDQGAYGGPGGDW
jgi:hypothetical protein